MPERVWNPHTTVVVCGVSEGKVTRNGSGVQRYMTLKEALAVFPDLDPHRNTERFTCALGNPQKDEMRFETWAANKFYST
jgi:hypothetical protein